MDVGKVIKSCVKLMAMKVRGIGGRHHHMSVLRIYQLIDGTRFHGVPHFQTPFTISQYGSKHILEAIELHFLLSQLNP